MTDYIKLIGAEQVQNAALGMSGAAEQMERAASSISYAIDRFAQLIERFEVAIDRINSAQTQTTAEDSAGTPFSHVAHLPSCQGGGGGRCCNSNCVVCYKGG